MLVPSFFDKLNRRKHVCFRRFSRAGRGRAERMLRQRGTEGVRGVNARAAIVYEPPRSGVPVQQLVDFVDKLHRGAVNYTIKCNTLGK